LVEIHVNHPNALSDKNANQKSDNMKLRYVLVRICNLSELAQNVRERLGFEGEMFFSCSGGSQELSFGYNYLFDKDDYYSFYARIDEGRSKFEFKSDYWNILSHYCYQDDSLLIMSNDQLFIASLIQPALEEKGIFDSLIFGRPYKAGSFFKNISRLSAFQSGFVDLKAKQNIVQTKAYPHWRSLLNDYQDMHVADLFSEDFAQIKERIDDKEVSLQFSGGSDSVTIFNALVFNQIPFKCCSFSTNARTNAYIDSICRNFSIPNEIIEAFENEETLKQAIRLSGGLAPTPRFTSFFSQLEPSYLFDGYAISKGDFSDAYVHPLFKGFLLGKGSESIHEIYPEMTGRSQKDLFDYWSDTYSQAFPNVNTAKGLTAFQEYVMEYINQNINGPVIGPAIQMGHSVQSYFLTLRFILSYFAEGGGFATSVSIRDDYPGYRKSLEILALINARMDKRIYSLLLDKQLSFRDVLEWNYITRIKYRYRFMRKIIRTKRQKNEQEVKETYDLPCLIGFGIERTQNRRLRMLDSSIHEMLKMTRDTEGWINVANDRLLHE
jgi:hypothetical protein